MPQASIATTAFNELSVHVEGNGSVAAGLDPAPALAATEDRPSSACEITLPAGTFQNPSNNSTHEARCNVVESWRLPEGMPACQFEQDGLSGDQH